MTIPNSALVSIRPHADHWTLHLSGTTIKKVSVNSALIRVGAENHPQRVILSASPPSPRAIVSRVKLVWDNGKWKVGPLLGILTVKRGSGFKGNKKNFIDIMRTAKQLGALVYVLAVEDIDWDNQSTGAYLYQENEGNWAYIPKFPLPDVIYNRIPYREDEKKEHVQAAIRRFQAEPSIHLYNQHFFNKWNLYDTLSRDPRVAHHIPETKKLKGSEPFFQMVNKYPLLYLKPISGKAGQGIMTVERINSKFIWKYRKGSKLIAQSFKEAKQLWSQIKNNITNDYVIQQGITLRKHENRPYDIRVLVQKDDSGTWQLSGVGIRVAGINSITTHVPRGGSIASPEVVLRQSMTEASYAKLMDRLHDTVLGLAKSLETAYHSLGEASMDIGLSEDGKLRFFEANAKPMKFDEPQIRKTSLERIIQYAQYLSHFSEKGDSKRASEANHL